MRPLTTPVPDWKEQVSQGDSPSVLIRLSSNFEDLVVASPPHADSRRRRYRLIHSSDYVEWFLTSTKEFPVLKLSGAFVLIKETP